MRRLICTSLILALAAPASAHTLPEEVGELAQFGHQLLGSHHFPLLLLLLIVGLAAIRAYRGSRPD